MPNYSGSFGDVINRGIKTLTQQTNIRQMVAGSKARALLEAHAREIDNLSILQETNLQKAFLPTTYGQFLDHFGVLVGLARYPSRNAEALAEDRVFRFFVRGGGTFGSINGGSGFVVPAETQLRASLGTTFEDTAIFGTEDDADGVYNRGVYYNMVEDTYLSADATEVWVSAQASTPGAGGNLAAPKMIKSHNFAGYDDYFGKTLLVENTQPVLNGFDEEDQASYRYRISKEITAAEKGSNTAIINAALSVPGVADVVIIPWEDGAGRFNIYIKSVSSFISDQMVDDVQVAIDEVSSVGSIGYARKPYDIGIEIDTTLSFTSDLTDEEKAEIRESVEIFVFRYLNSIDLGQPFVVQELARAIKDQEPRVSSVGFNKTTLFDGVFVWYPARLASGGRRRERLITDVLEVPAHGRIIAENSVSDPVRIF